MQEKTKMKKSDIIESIRENYQKLESSIVAQLNLATPNHYATTGTYREKIWASLFRQIIPHKFSIAQGVFIIDSSASNNISKEVDLAVFDEQYTPYIFNYGNIKFIPIEAVAIVIQCKSRNVKSKKDKSILKSWTRSIEELTTCDTSIARMAAGLFTRAPETQKATRPIKILCALANCTKEHEPICGFDIAIYTKKSDKERLHISFSNKIDNIYKAYQYLNFKNEEKSIEKYTSTVQKKIEEEESKRNDEIFDAKKTEHIKKLKGDIQKHLKLNDINLDAFKINQNGDAPILSLIFQLNQLLMLINNPMLFPHQAYVEMFNQTGQSTSS